MISPHRRGRQVRLPSLHMRFEGDFAPYLRADLEAFARALADDPHGGDTSQATMVLAEPHPGGITLTMRRELERWMPRDAFLEWSRQQKGRPVATAGKTFTAADGTPTAVVFPLPDGGMMRAIAAHEIVELANHDDREFDGLDANDAQALVIADEYAHDRTRIGIARALGWAPSSYDERPYLWEQTNDLIDALRGMPSEGEAPQEFWQHWVNIARVWAMVAGRADAGAAAETAALERWRDHTLINRDAWEEIHSALRSAACATRDVRRQFARYAWDRLIAAGHDAWASS